MNISHTQQPDMKLFMQIYTDSMKKIRKSLLELNIIFLLTVFNVGLYTNSSDVFNV